MTVLIPSSLYSLNLCLEAGGNIPYESVYTHTHLTGVNGDGGLITVKALLAADLERFVQIEVDLT